MSQGFYVQRNAQGEIIAKFSQPQRGAPILQTQTGIRFNAADEKEEFTYEDVVGYELGIAEEYVMGDPDILVEVTWEEIRAKRNALLTASDWTQLPDADLDAQKKAEWTVYRRDLRNVPEAFTNPADVTWPESP